MPAFDPKSRYVNTPTYQVTDRRGRVVTVVAVPPLPRAPLLGHHVLRQGERLDHLAYQYLKDATGFWRIAEANDAMRPEALSERPTLAIPMKVPG